MLRVANGAISCCPMPCKGEEREPRAAVGRGLPPGTWAGQRRLEGYSPWDQKELDMTEQLGTAQGLNYT